MPKKKQSETSAKHISQKPFVEMLASFASGNATFDDSMSSGVSMTGAFSQDIATSKRRSADDDVSSYTELDAEFDVLHSDLTVESIRADSSRNDEDFEYDDAFDGLIEAAFLADEDISFRNNLIAMGRKYTIKGMEEDGSVSEVSQSFARQERAIDDLLQEYQQVGMELQRDIDFLRGARSRNYKSLADLLDVRASLLNGKLSAIKELNSVAKTKHELTLKLKASAGDTGNGGGAATSAIQKLFSIGRGSLMAIDNPGDSGARDDDDSASYDEYDGETAMMTALPVPEPVSDGDKFIEHEKEGVEYVLDVGEDGSERNIYAINSEGDVIADYPLPTDPESLTFSINELTGTATDQLQRTYKVRKAGQDLTSDE